MSDEQDDHGYPDAETLAVPKLRGRDVIQAAYSLHVVEGPDLGKRFSLDVTRPLRVLIGTSPACDARLRDPHVSRRHAAVELEGKKLCITDLSSTNGTFVDGVMIAEAYLRGDEVVRVGATALRVVEGPEVASLSVPEQMGFGQMLGQSLVMRRLYPLCQRLAQSSVPVVIEGETGTGKECLAEAMHRAGPRADKPFVVFDCTAVAPSLLESELFGHEKGAFTGSVATRAGVFERAHGGTLLIDEIGDLALELQPKLLRAIERAEITRIGGNKPIRVDVRILAATRRDLDRETQAGRFRDDLFHRIAVTRIELPPLRKRYGDVTLLAKQFCAMQHASPDALPTALLHRWESFDWPGNVRELRNAVARWLALGELADHADQVDEAYDVDGQRLEAPEYRGDPIARILTLELPIAEARQRIIDDFDRRYVEHVLRTHGGNVTRAAAAAGIARRHLQRIKAKFDTT